MLCEYPSPVLNLHQRMPSTFQNKRGVENNLKILQSVADNTGVRDTQIQEFPKEQHPNCTESKFHPQKGKDCIFHNLIKKIRKQFIYIFHLLNPHILVVWFHKNMPEKSL